MTEDVSVDMMTIICVFIINKLSNVTSTTVFPVFFFNGNSIIIILNWYKMRIMLDVLTILNIMRIF